MKLNKLILFFLFFALLFIIFVYYKKKIENFKELVIQSSSKTGITSRKSFTKPDSFNMYRFNRICVGDTCMDGNVLASTLELFRNEDARLRTTSTCSDNVCIFPEHLKLFNNFRKNKPDSVNPSDVFEAKKVNPFNSSFRYIDFFLGPGSSNNGFRLSLAGSTNEILKGLGTDLYNVGAKQEKRHPSVNPKPFVTRMLPGRICYSPNTLIPYQITFQDTSDPSFGNARALSPYKVGNTDVTYTHYLYFDYENNPNTGVVYRGKSGVKDYTYCIANKETGDYQYIPRNIEASSRLSNSGSDSDYDSTLKNNNMITNAVMPSVFPNNIRQYEAEFQFGKPYDTFNVLPSTNTSVDTSSTLITTPTRPSNISGIDIPVGG